MSTDAKVNNFPIYSEYGGFNKVESETSYLALRIKGKHFEIHYGNNPGLVADILKCGTVITKEKFVEVLTKATSFANFALFMELSEPATDEDMREGCTCDDDELTYEEMLDEAQTNDLYERNEGISQPVNDFI